MDAIAVDTEKLKTIRKGRKIGRPKLAKLTGMTERQIARLESAAPSDAQLSAAAIARIAESLQVPAGTLTGDLSMIEEDLKPVEKKSSCSCCH